LRRVLLARTCAIWGEDVVGEVKGVDEVCVRFACSGEWSRRDRRSEIEVDPKCRGLADIALLQLIVFYCWWALFGGSQCILNPD
jgi:hypothetical protein